MPIEPLSKRLFKHHYPFWNDVYKERQIEFVTSLQHIIAFFFASSSFLFRSLLLLSKRFAWKQAAFSPKVTFEIYIFAAFHVWWRCNLGFREWVIEPIRKQSLKVHIKSKKVIWKKDRGKGEEGSLKNVSFVFGVSALFFWCWRAFDVMQLS